MHAPVYTRALSCLPSTAWCSSPISANGPRTHAPFRARLLPYLYNLAHLASSAVYRGITREAFGPLEPCTTLNSTRCPRSRVRGPSASIAEEWTKTSPPVSLLMKPYPLESSNHLTIPNSRSVTVQPLQLFRVPCFWAKTQYRHKSKRYRTLRAISLRHIIPWSNKLVNLDRVPRGVLRW